MRGDGTEQKRHIGLSDVALWPLPCKRDSTQISLGEKDMEKWICESSPWLVRDFYFLFMRYDFCVWVCVSVCVSSFDFAQHRVSKCPCWCNVKGESILLTTNTSCKYGAGFERLFHILCAHESICYAFNAFCVYTWRFLITFLVAIQTTQDAWNTANVLYATGVVIL